MPDRPAPCNQAPLTASLFCGTPTEGVARTASACSSPSRSHLREATRPCNGALPHPSLLCAGNSGLGRQGQPTIAGASLVITPSPRRLSCTARRRAVVVQSGSGGRRVLRNSAPCHASLLRRPHRVSAFGSSSRSPHSRTSRRALCPSSLFYLCRRLRKVERGARNPSWKQ